MKWKRRLYRVPLTRAAVAARRSFCRHRKDVVGSTGQTFEGTGELNLGDKSLIESQQEWSVEDAVENLNLPVIVQRGCGFVINLALSQRIPIARKEVPLPAAAPPSSHCGKSER
ncbi:hypothetical protein SCAR479_02317 [Seiridium cardinale]|uniref:Uncharacterized protein n=1 Tax=Seiridium cardinale TaxID=138064 RepID=A0ABR2X5M6_9PEZI